MPRSAYRAQVSEKFGRMSGYMTLDANTSNPAARNAAKFALSLFSPFLLPRSCTCTLQLMKSTRRGSTVSANSRTRGESAFVLMLMNCCRTSNWHSLTKSGYMNGSPPVRCRSQVAIQRERNGVVAGQRERSRDRVARAEVDGTPSASARAERGRQPRPGRKQLPQRLELVHAPLGGGGQVGLDHREVGQPLQGAPAPTRAPLLHLHRPNVPLRLIVGERHRKVGRKPQDHRLVLLEAARQPQPVGGRPGP